MTGHCSKCSEPAEVMLTFDYAEGQVWLDDLSGPALPYSGYPLCPGHGERFTPPQGWVLFDQRAAAAPPPLALEVA